MRGKPIIVLVLSILIVIASFPIGLLVGNCFIAYNISDSYFDEFYLSDDVVFDEPEIVGFYGEALVFNAGDKGYIVETVDVDKRIKNGYVNVHMTSSNGKAADCAIINDTTVEKTIEVSNTGNYNVLVVFGPNKIESYDTVFNEYAQACDAYSLCVNKTRVYSIIICVCISILVIGVIDFLTIKSRRKKNMATWIGKNYPIQNMWDEILFMMTYNLH